MCVCFFFQPLLQVLKFFFVHLCSSLQGTLHNLYSLLFFLVNIEDNVSFRLGEELEMICICFLFYVKFFFGGLFLVIFFFIFSPIFKKRKKKKEKKRKSVALARVLSQSSFCYFYLKNSTVFHVQLLCTCTLAT